jgi:L-lactate dehydrogenase complex protein LldG
MSEFQKLLAEVRTALEQGSSEERRAAHEAEAPIPVTLAARRAELGSRFVRELEAVNGRVLEVASAGEAIEKIAALALELKAKSALSAEALTAELVAMDAELERVGLEVIATGPVARDELTRMRRVTARCNLGIIEADYAIAASGTIALIADATRPRSVSLLPPISIIIVHVDRILPDLATLMRTVGPEVVSNNPMVLITGPSRTADIEKRIVLGVHGPKELYVVLIWPKHE